MNSVLIPLAIFALCCVVNGQQGPCQTTNGGQGECKSVYKCQPLLAIVNKPSRTAQDIEVLRRAQCGFEGREPAVCCPGANQPVRVSDGCFTPEGKPGQCVNISSCPAISNLLQAPVSDVKIQYVQQSRCNSPDKYSVCCGPVPDFDSVEKGNCANRVTAFPPDPRTECCGIDTSTENKIYGGEEAGVDQYPWLVLIEYRNAAGDIRTLCGGSLISGKYVLTAAHCVTGPNLKTSKPVSIRLGEYDTEHEGPDCVPIHPKGMDCTKGTTTIPIERTVPHPHYNPSDPKRRHDIALIRMTQMAKFTEFIRPICLPTVDITQGTDTFNTTAAGWGQISSRKFSSPKKLQVVLPFVSKSICQPIFSVPGRSIEFTTGQFCAGGEKGKDACKGDSGGPLMYENGRIIEAIGVVSFGTLTCGLENIPGVYTNVYEYISWIRNTIIP